MLKVVKIKSGNPCDYLTKGKAYDAIQLGGTRNLFKIINNHGNESIINLNSCAHLRGGSWSISNSLGDLLTDYNHSRLSLAMGKHRSYINTMIKQGVSDKLFNKIKDLVTIDWNSDKPLYVNDGKHVPFTIKPISCKQDKHKEWLQSLMMKGCIKL